MDQRYRHMPHAPRFVAPGVALVLAVVLGLGGCAGRPAAEMSARQVLESAVENLLSLKSYRYAGSSTMTVEGDPRLDSTSEFVTLLELNGEGALDGHMIVESEEPGGSYETYSYEGVEYTRVEGGEWTATTGGSKGEGYGMVSAGARAIIASFAELAEDVRFSGETDESYIVSLTMGEKYRRGAAAISGPDAAAEVSETGGEGSARKTSMALTVSKTSLRITGAVMTDSTADVQGLGTITVITRSSYSMFDRPVDVVPPPEALEAAR